MLKLAVQKSGRLNEKSLQIVKNTGIKFGTLVNKSGQLIAKSNNFPIQILFLRDDDIPGYVSDGVADIGIVGENEILEKNKKVEILKKLGFAKCRMSIAIPKAVDYNGHSSLQGKKIATSYPYILNEFLKKNEIKAEVHEISGSVEIAPSIGLANVICDLVSSGSTLLMNGLKEVETILKTEATLIKAPTLSQEKSKILEQLLFRFKAVKTGEKHKYVLLNAPKHSIEKIIQILPGMRSPTVLPLAESDWFSVHSVIEEKMFWECISKLKEAGAEGILSTDIEKMII